MDEQLELQTTKPKQDLMVTGDFLKSLESMASETEQLKQICKKLMSTPHYAKMKEDGIFAICTAAKQLNIHPFQALNGGLYYVGGRVGMSAELMNRLIRQAGHSVQKDPASDTTKCILIGKRGDNGDSMRVIYTIDEARKAGLIRESGPWVAHPQAMLFARALSILARQLYPDVIAGVYSEDEVREIANEPSATPTGLIDVPVKEVMSEGQIDDLKAIFAEMPDLKDKVLKTYGALRFEELDPRNYEFVKNWGSKELEKRRGEAERIAAERFKKANDGE